MYKNLCWALFLMVTCAACGMAPRDLVLVQPAPVPRTLPVSEAPQLVEPVPVAAIEPETAPVASPSASDVRRRSRLDNVYVLGESNHTALFQDYVDVDVRMIEFSNDSKRLNVLGILALRDLSKRYIDGSDIISVIGCSIGKTSLRNGNLRLSQGRTNVVKDELLFNDVPVTSIYDELCWGSEKLQNSGLPRRGVRVVLKRKR